VKQLITFLPHVFSLGSFGLGCYKGWGSITSLLNQESSFDDWWCKINEQVDGQIRQGLNSILILGAWTIWNRSNRCVSYRASPNLDSITLLVQSLQCRYSHRGPLLAATRQHATTPWPSARLLIADAYHHSRAAKMPPPSPSCRSAALT
jgi:hypothetical protein